MLTIEANFLAWCQMSVKIKLSV